MRQYTIRFSEEWDKLLPYRRVEGDRFTTARKYTPSKEKYYRSCFNRIGSVALKGKKIGEAKLIGIKVENMPNIPMLWWRQDTYDTYQDTDVLNLMQRYYNEVPDTLIILEFEWTNVHI